MTFNSVSIKQKTTLIIFLVSMVVMLLSSGLFAFFEARQIHTEVREDVHSLATILAANASQSLAVRDLGATEKLITTLDAAPDIINAYIFLPDGQMVAAYLRAAHSGKRIDTEHDLEMMRLEEKQIEEGLRFGVDKTWTDQRQVSVFMPVAYGGSHVGYIYLRAELTAFYSQLLYYALVWLIVFGIAVMLSFLLSVRLQKLISRPVDQLVEHMRRIASKKKLDGFSAQTTLDEFDLLYKGFDEMLKALQDRDRLLEGHRRNLEAKVKERTEELEEAKIEAEQATEAKSRFLANMSHEIRTPMIGVLGMADLLRQADIDAKDRRLADTIYHSGEALLGILNDILDFSKIEAGRLELSRAPFNLGRTVMAVVELMQVKAQEKGLRILSTLNVASGVIVVGDAGRLRQVLLNLIGNAIKFTERGHVKVTLGSLDALQNEKQTYRFEIEDTGPGISNADQQKVFDAFRQGGNINKRNPGGTGLGLTIVHDLVTLMGGTVSVRSKVGQGSVFTVTLPLEPGREVADVEVQPADPAGNDRLLAVGQKFGFDGVVSGRRILLAEDNVTTQELLTILLQNAGVDLAIVLNGREAVDYLSEHEVDLVFMDCQMPEMDGFEATRHLRERGLKTPIIALTAYARSEDHQTCLDAGMDDFLCKPFRQQDLRKILVKWLNAPPEQAEAGGQIEPETDPL